MEDASVSIPSIEAGLNVHGIAMRYQKDPCICGRRHVVSGVRARTSRHRKDRRRSIRLRQLSQLNASLQRPRLPLNPPWPQHDPSENKSRS